MLSGRVVHEEEPQERPHPRQDGGAVEHPGPAPGGDDPAGQRRREAPEQRRGWGGGGDVLKVAFLQTSDAL